ncbi:hypothetical protein ABZ464_10485 [Streptomyces sp. NPDC005820]|uniref:hypothetical protein n=1 Tax=Streptomyces sp. NPDC005820 TaxID=3157069 RepID=UPI00340A67D6
MSEQEYEAAAGAGPVGSVGPVEPVGPELVVAPVEPVDPAARRGRLRRAAAVGGSLVLAGVLVAGVGLTVVTVRDADRDPGAPVWTFPKETPATGRPEHGETSRTGLAAMLVPYGTEGFVRGPDIGEFGADAQLSGERAAALRKEALKDLPRSQRKRLEQRIDKQRITGMAMRSYLSEETSALDVNEGVYSVGITLSQMDNKAAVRDIATFQGEFLDALDVFRKGPEIKGHKNAKCFLPPKDADSDLEGMFCSAYVGEVLVSLTAEAVKPLDTKGVALLLREQLDRIAEPGETV